MSSLTSRSISSACPNTFRSDDICVLTTEEVEKKIISVIATHLNSRSPSVLVQYWAAKKIGNIYVLTTTCQPFGVSVDNKELQTYRKACLDHKIYVCKEPEKEVAFGLPGRVFLNCTPEQTQNVHRYPPDHRPPCEEAIFNKIWGSFAMPVIEADTCVGVLEFVMDTPNVSYTNDILDVYSALVHAGLKSSSIQLDRPRMTNINSRKRLRKTKSFSVTKYCCLVPYFGLSSAHAAEKLGLKTGAFRDLQRNVGIPEWPWIRHTAARDSSVPEAQINQAVAESTNEIAFQTSDTEARIESERAYPGFMPNFDEMDYQDKNDPLIDGLDDMPCLNIYELMDQIDQNYQTRVTM